jgi:hypothetical protein
MCGECLLVTDVDFAPLDYRAINNTGDRSSSRILHRLASLSARITGSSIL